MRRAVTTLAIGDDFAIGGDAGFFVHAAQLGGGLERAVGTEIARPFDVHGARNGAAARRTHRGAAVFAGAAGIEQDAARLTDRATHVLPGGDGLRDTRPLPLADRCRRRLTRDRKALVRPGAKPAVEQPHRRMAEILEKPEGAGGANPRL